jgi:hypothetical protein
MIKILKLVRFKIWYNIIIIAKKTNFYFFIYRSFWNLKIGINNNKFNAQEQFLTAIPNFGAGIGHQISNWISGYSLARKFNLIFAHTPFSNQLEEFLGFGDNEILCKDLFRKGYKKVLLPLFNVENSLELKIIQDIINSYKGHKVLFQLEVDQFYKNQFMYIDFIKSKYFTSSFRLNDKVIYNYNNFNIAIHIRRGDIMSGHKNFNSNLLLRWQGNEYFVNVLNYAIKNNNTKKPVKIYIFSQGEVEDFVEFNQFKDIIFCLDMSPIDSFIQMVYADLLITSKSSFSYKPALLNNGIKCCPLNFWHGYPNDQNWKLFDDQGNYINF